MRRSLIPLVFVLVLLFVVYGCKTVKNSIDYYEACKGDSDCVAEMVKASNTAHQVTSSVVAATPLGGRFDDILGGIAGSLVAFLVGVKRGKRLCKK